MEICGGRLIFLSFDGNLLAGFAIEIHLFFEKLIPREVVLNLVVGYKRPFSGDSVV